MGNKLPKLESQLNLVNAAIAEYDFLHLVEKHPALYSTPLLENALYRYETFWLPLCKDNPNTMLPAPLDIEWVWHTHILNPYAYRKDCQEILGVIIDHQPAMLRQNFINKARSLWQTKYPDVPFEVNLNEPNPVPLSPDYQRKSSYDIVNAAQRQRSFNYNSSLPHFRDKKFLRKAVKRYKVMLQIKRDNPNAFVVPCYDNDLIWHTHQQHVSLYKGDTSNILGSMLDHDDSTSDRSPGSHLETSSDLTRKLWRKAGVKFGVPGAMYRGDAPLPLIDTMPNRFAGLANQNNFNGYCFYTTQLVRTMQQGNHIKDVLHHVSLMAPNTLYKDSVPCEYNDNILQTNAGTHAFTWRVVHCRNPTLSALEILDVYGNVVATAHTIGSFSLPNSKHVEDPLRCATHSAKTERSMLIRGAKGDYAILRTSWVNFVKGRNPGTLKAEIMILDGKDSYWVPVSPTTTQGNYQWTLRDGLTGAVDFEKGNISFNNQVSAVGEYIALGCALSISFVLCQPRPPPPKEGDDIKPYPAPASNRPNVMHVDNMDMLVAGGLYSRNLPRWYHANCHGGYFYQIHPSYLHHHHHHYYGGCGAGDFGYDYDAGGATFESGDGVESGGGWESGGDSGGGFDFGTSDFDSGGGDWGGSSGDAGGCGGCGGGGSGGCGSSGGGGGCGSSCGGGGGCGSSCGGGGGCGGGGCGGD